MKEMVIKQFKEKLSKQSSTLRYKEPLQGSI